MDWHKENSFLTLTYSEDNLPCGGTLVLRDLTLWLKRFREVVAPAVVRYYAVGEYGDKTFRPHYHVAMFGFGGCRNGFRHSVKRSVCRCENCSVVRETWGKGRTDCAFLEKDSAQYVAGYICKKLTRKNDPRLGERVPEFAKMSLKPGLGRQGYLMIAEQLKGSDYLDLYGDVPSSFVWKGKSWPVDRYGKVVMRDALGITKEKRFDVAQAVTAAKVSVLQEAGRYNLEGLLQQFKEDREVTEAAINRIEYQHNTRSGRSL